MDTTSTPQRPSSDDLRAAAGMATSLSSFLITAVLAVLGAQAVVATFVLDRRTDLTWFYVVSGLGTLALTLSVYFGGRGIWELTTAGAEGHWKVRTDKHRFDVQAILAWAGVVLVVVSAFLGHAKSG